MPAPSQRLFGIASPRHGAVLDILGTGPKQTAPTPEDQVNDERVKVKTLLILVIFVFLTSVNFRISIYVTQRRSAGSLFAEALTVFITIDPQNP